MTIRNVLIAALTLTACVQASEPICREPQAAFAAQRCPHPPTPGVVVQTRSVGGFAPNVSGLTVYEDGRFTMEGTNPRHGRTTQNHVRHLLSELDRIGLFSQPDNCMASFGPPIPDTGSSEIRVVDWRGVRHHFEEKNGQTPPRFREASAILRQFEETVVAQALPPTPPLPQWPPPAGWTPPPGWIVPPGWR